MFLLKLLYLLGYSIIAIIYYVYTVVINNIPKPFIYSNLPKIYKFIENNNCNNDITSVEKDVEEVKNGLISYFDSDILTFTNIGADSNQNQIVNNYHIPSGYTVISRELILNSITGSWNVLATYLNKYNSISVHNYGSSANTVQVYIRSLCVKS